MAASVGASCGGPRGPARRVLLEMSVWSKPARPSSRDTGIRAQSRGWADRRQDRWT